MFSDGRPSIPPRHTGLHAQSFKKWLALMRIRTGDFLIQFDTQARFFWDANESFLHHWLRQPIDQVIPKRNVGAQHIFGIEFIKPG